MRSNKINFRCFFLPVDFKLCLFFFFLNVYSIYVKYLVPELRSKFQWEFILCMYYRLHVAWWCHQCGLPFPPRSEWFLRKSWFSLWVCDISIKTPMIKVMYACKYPRLYTLKALFTEPKPLVRRGCLYMRDNIQHPLSGLWYSRQIDHFINPGGKS